jgi:Mce-associated membrane protein
VKADDIVNRPEQAQIPPAGQPVRSRSVTHRVTRRRRIVADGAADSPPTATTETESVGADAAGSEPAGADIYTDEPDADDETDADETDAAADETDAAETAAVDAEPATSAGKRKSRPPSDAGRRRPTRAQHERRWRITTAVLALMLVASTVAGTIVGLRWNERRETADGLRAALAASRQFAVNFMSLSVPTVDRDMQRILDGATGDFKQQYEDGKADVRTLVVEKKAESTCTVLRAAILSGDRDSATVLVVLDATVKNTSTPDGRLSHYRLQLDIVKDGGSGRWLVSRLEYVG